jgi:DGQHR domain-containing protein
MEVEVRRLEQKGQVLYLGWLPAEELIKRGKVDMWTPTHTDGYQRGLVQKRIGEVAWYLVEGEGIMPTSVLLSVRSETVFDEKRSVLDIPDEVTLWIIDGQHRVAGLVRAIEQGAQELKDYPFPVVIMVNPDKFDEMRAFYLVNSKAKSVPTDVAERILQRTMLERGRDWILRREAKQEKKADKAVNTAKAVGVVDYLRSQCPVWKGMVAVPGESKPHPYSTKQHTLVVSLVGGPYKVPILAGFDPTDLGVLVGRYWEAAAEVWPEAFAEPGMYSVRKSVGVWSLNMLFVDVFERCREVRDYTKPKMVELLRGLGIDSEFWSSDTDVGNSLTFGTSMKTIGLLYAFLQEQLPRLTLAGL